MSTSTSIYSGWLTKKGGSVNKWHARYCVLTTERFAYYEDVEQKQERGSFSLDTVKALNRRSPPLRSPIFEIEIHNRVLSFQALNTSEMDCWIKHLSSYPGIKLTKTPDIVLQGIIKEGILNKMGYVHKAWKSRKFTLMMFPEEQIIYTTTDEFQEQRGVIELRDITSVRLDAKNPTIFEVETENRIFRLQAEYETESFEWVQIITAATRDAVWQENPTEVPIGRNSSEGIRPNDVRIIKQGWLQKKGYYVRAWRWRYFVLQNQASGNPALKYYVSPDTSIIRGTIDLSRLKNLRTIENTNKFEIRVPGRLFELEAESEIEAQEWITKIHFATKERTQTEEIEQPVVKMKNSTTGRQSIKEY